MSALLAFTAALLWLLAIITVFALVRNAARSDRRKERKP
jgi:hypothetical protein